MVESINILPLDEKIKYYEHEHKAKLSKKINRRKKFKQTGLILGTSLMGLGIYYLTNNYDTLLYTLEIMGIETYYFSGLNNIKELEHISAYYENKNNKKSTKIYLITNNKDLVYKVPLNKEQQIKELIKTFNYYLNTYQMITFDLKTVKLLSFLNIVYESFVLENIESEFYLAMINSIENAFAKNIALKKISISQNDILKSLTEIPRKEENKTRNRCLN